ncbi:hypothetical protein J7643_09545 [bacterium]|nr:hypothetical protein [bacterium]
MRPVILCLALSLSMAGCALVGLGARPPEATVSVAPLVGRVEPGVVHRFRSVQADLVTDVAQGASVSFIKPGATPLTVATTVTDADGRFQLQLGNAFRPEAGSVYYLEAFKGLGSNSAGHSAARVRTLVRWTSGGWQSLTGAVIDLTLTTTALAAAAQINTAQGAAVDLGGLMGRLQRKVSDGVTPDTFSAVANLSVADFHGAYEVVSAALGGDLDPLATITKADGSFVLRPATGLGVLPALGADLGGTVTLSGLVFDPDPALNRVRFNGAEATVTAVDPARRYIRVTVPDGATRGALTVTVGSKASGVLDYPVFGTVRLTLAGIPGATATASVTLTPPSGSPVTKTVSNPAGATASVLFTGLTPGEGWTVSARALNAANQAWATAAQLDGPRDPLTLTTRPVPGPYALTSGLNTWGVGLRIAPVGVTATGSY